MRIGKLFFATLFLAFAALSLAVPKVLIVQVSGDKGASPIALADALADALTEEGKTDPIVWSQTDPIFRDAVLDGRVPTMDKPGPDDVQRAAKALGCDYIILAQAELNGTAVAGRIDMYRGSKPVWSDTNMMDTGHSSGNDLDNAIRSVARTWAIRISAGPLKSIQSEPKPPPTPAPSQGQVPKSPAADPVPQVTDTAKALDDYKHLMSEKKIPEATNLLRQAVDQSPLDVQLRIQLIKHLASIGRAREAAEEARRASQLLPDSADLRALAAQAYLDSGQTDQAASQLNEQLARNPNDASTRSMLADLALNQLNAQAAMAHIAVAMKAAPSKDLAYRQALCDAIGGDDKAVSADIAVANQLQNWTGTEEASYKFCMGIFGQAMDQSVGDLRSLSQRAAVKPDDADVAQEIDAQLAMLQARQTFVDSWTPPASHKKSQGGLSLALKLLSQSLSELKAFLADKNQDTLTDANIDLGQSIKQLTAARNALATEGTVARHGSTPVHTNY